MKRFIAALSNLTRPCVLLFLRDCGRISSRSVVVVAVEVSAIEAEIKAAKARRKRASTAVVGDMSALMDSLPTFELLLDRATVQSRLNQRSVFDDAFNQSINLFVHKHCKITVNLQ